MTRNKLATLLLSLAVVSRVDAQVAQPPRDDLFNQAKDLSKRDDWENAIARFREFLGKNSDDSRASEARFWIGYCQVKSDEFDDAIAELTPFEGALSQDKWADDALLQLGHAYRGKDENHRAIGVWKRLLEKYPDSVWRTEAALQIIDIEYDDKDYMACLPYCERVVNEATDFGGITERVISVLTA